MKLLTKKEYNDIKSRIEQLERGKTDKHQDDVFQRKAQDLWELFNILLDHLDLTLEWEPPEQGRYTIKKKAPSP